MKYTKEDIKAMQKQDPATLTPQERRLANLHPIEKGEVRNPKGKPKGVKSWSTHFKKLMGDEEFLKTIISSTPKEWDGIVGDYPADVIAAGVIATVTREVAEAVINQRPLSEATTRSIALLNKIGFGEKVVVDAEEGFFDKPVINFTVVPPKEQK